MAARHRRDTSSNGMLLRGWTRTINPREAPERRDEPADLESKGTGAIPHCPARAAIAALGRASWNMTLAHALRKPGAVSFGALGDACHVAPPNWTPLAADARCNERGGTGPSSHATSEAAGDDDPVP